MYTSPFTNQVFRNIPAGPGMTLPRPKATGLPLLTSNHAGLMRKQSQNDNDLRNLQIQLDAALYELVNVRNELITSNANYAASESNLQTVQAQYEMAESNHKLYECFYDDAERRIAKLKGALSQSHQEQARLAGVEHTLSQLRHVHSQFKDEHQTTLGELAASRNGHAELTERLRSATAVTMFLTRRAEGSEAERNEALKAVHEHQADLYKAKKMISLAEAKVVSLAPQVKELTAANESLKAESADLKEALLESQANIDNEKAKAAALAAQVDVFNTQIVYTAHKNALTEAEMRDLRAATQDAALDFDAVKLERDMLLDQEAALAARCAALKTQLRAAHTSAASAAASSVRTTTQRDAAQMHAHHLATLLAASQRQAAADAAERTRLAAALKDTIAQLHAERAGQHDLAPALAAARAELVDSKRAGAVHVQLNGDLRTQLHAAQAENGELKTQNAHLATQLAAERAAHARLLAEVDDAQVQAAERARAARAGAAAPEKENALVENLAEKVEKGEKAEKIERTPRAPAKGRFRRAPSARKPALGATNAPALPASASLQAALAPVTSRVSASSERTPTPGASFAFTFAFGGAGAYVGRAPAKGGAAFSGRFLKRMMGRAPSPQIALERSAASAMSPALA
ncbi:hypothetical protein PsYK624_039880 [Phanerochaete sordida]|uniref:Uncharacterized protein n=1 Tax=Phanerochaete sordida TaxID=48140 RepID=A0A9P3G4W5_9APHY|nr:hypothetical protein PsYK624_039880 [Phanerochaete sordida]